jgi:hypothetical protein
MRNILPNITTTTITTIITINPVLLSEKVVVSVPLAPPVLPVGAHPDSPGPQPSLAEMGGVEVARARKADDAAAAEADEAIAAE